MEGKTLGNRYELITRIGMGGMAVVYKAKDNMLNRFVAVKILREEFKENEDFIRRFNIESQAAACLSHQNIVQIYDVGEENSLHYIVMEYLEGQTLKQYIEQKGGRLSWREAANFSMQICRALEHAHSKHVVHRDIKPQNIVITEGNKLKVADFGIARAANNSTTVNTAVGSAHYLSPEQARGGYTDLRSDIYSLGVVMYEMFTGTLPFDADNDVSVLMQHMHENPPLPTEINPDIPDGIEAIIVHAMNKEQRMRYANASDILEDLVMVYQNPSIDPAELNASLNNKSIGTEVKKTSQKKKHNRSKSKEKESHRGLIAAVIISAAALIAFIIGGIYLLFFSTGSEVKIPNLIGATYEEAVRIAENASSDGVEFEVIVDRSEHSEKPKDTIIAQAPEGGSKVKRSREIKVVVSSGSVVLILDDYKGQSFKDVSKMLKSKGIKVILEEKDDDTVPSGDIIKQVPAEGTEMVEGDEITLYVSIGMKNTVVPNVIGKTLDEALIAIERNNLKVGTVKEQIKSGTIKGQVFNQSHSPFESVPVDTVIDLVISSGDKEPLPENPQGAASEDNKKKSVKLSLGNLPQNRDKVNVRLVADGKTFYEKDFPTSSGIANITLDISESLSLDVYYDGVYITTKEVKY